MGPSGSKMFTPFLLEIAVGSFQLFLNFLLNGPGKTTFGIFEILKMKILTIFVSFSFTWEPREAKVSKRCSSATNLSETFSNLS